MTVDQRVVALLVSHDGARWLPAVVDGLRGQTTPVSGVVCVDTGSRDESPDLLLDVFDEVVTLSGRTSYPEAVRTGLEQVAPEDGCCTTTATRHPTLSSGFSRRRRPTRAPTRSAPSCASGPP
jgi:hypothetical protein